MGGKNFGMVYKKSVILYLIYNNNSTYSYRCACVCVSENMGPVICCF